MNKHGRKEISQAQEILRNAATAIDGAKDTEDQLKVIKEQMAKVEDAKGIVTALKDGEQEKFDNMSEGLQESERAQAMMEAASTLEEAEGQIEEAEEIIDAEEISNDELTELVDKLNEAADTMDNVG